MPPNRQPVKEIWVQKTKNFRTVSADLVDFQLAPQGVQAEP
jgi:hypothetical protein